VIVRMGHDLGLDSGRRGASIVVVGDLHEIP